VAARPDFAQAVARACELRDDWFNEQVVDAALRGARKRDVGPILRHMTRLRHRPGAVHRRRGIEKE
jgi:hypothetical protein